MDDFRSFIKKLTKDELLDALVEMDLELQRKKQGEERMDNRCDSVAKETEAIATKKEATGADNDNATKDTSRTRRDFAVDRTTDLVIRSRTTLEGWAPITLDGVTTHMHQVAADVAQLKKDITTQIDTAVKAAMKVTEENNGKMTGAVAHEIARLMDEIRVWGIENGRLSLENEQLRAENGNLHDQNADLAHRVDHQSQLIGQLSSNDEMVHKAKKVMVASEDTGRKKMRKVNKECKNYRTPSGCKWGENCKFLHTPCGDDEGDSGLVPVLC